MRWSKGKVELLMFVEFEVCYEGVGGKFGLKKTSRDKIGHVMKKVFNVLFKILAMTYSEIICEFSFKIFFIEYGNKSPRSSRLWVKRFDREMLSVVISNA